MKSIRSFLLLIFMAAGCSASTYSISIIKLINSPEKFVNMDMSVYGYFTTGVGGRLFLSEQHAIDGDLASSIAVIDPSESGEMTLRCRKKYVHINAAFELDRNQYSLVNVKKIVDGNGIPCWEL